MTSATPCGANCSARDRDRIVARARRGRAPSRTRAFPTAPPVDHLLDGTCTGSASPARTRAHHLAHRSITAACSSGVSSRRSPGCSRAEVNCSGTNGIRGASARSPGPEGAGTVDRIADRAQPGARSRHRREERGLNLGPDLVKRTRTPQPTEVAARHEGPSGARFSVADAVRIALGRQPVPNEVGRKAQSALR